MNHKYVNRVKTALTNSSAKYASLRSELAGVSENDIVEWLWRKCATDARLFLELFTKIHRKDGSISRWRFCWAQGDYHDKTWKKIPDNIMLKSRQWGFSTYELGVMYHSFCFLPGYKQKVITFEDDTATKLKRIVDTFHKTARETFTLLGFNPLEFIPYVKNETRNEVGNKHEIEDEDTESIIAFATQGGKGSGRALTLNRTYWTEYSKWTNIGEATAGITGSLAENHIHTIDATGQGIGNAFFKEFTKALAGKSAFTAHFYGRNECLDVYSPEHLRREKLKLGKRYPQEFPITWQEAFLQDDNARFDAERIEAARERQYLCDYLTDAELYGRPYVISCDPAEGTPNGSHTVIKIRCPSTGYEARPPIRRKMTPVECAYEIKSLFDAGYFGVIAPERNNDGKTVINELHHLTTVRRGRTVSLARFIYRHPEPGKELRDCKEGWPTTDATKVELECEYERQLADAWIKITSENEAIEARQYCLNPNGKRGRPLTTTDDGDRFYDDEIIAAMIGIMPTVRAQALRQSPSVNEPVAVAVGSLRRDED